MAANPLLECENIAHKTWSLSKQTQIPCRVRDQCGAPTHAAFVTVEPGRPLTRKYAGTCQVAAKWDLSSPTHPTQPAHPVSTSGFQDPPKTRPRPQELQENSKNAKNSENSENSKTCPRFCNVLPVRGAEADGAAQLRVLPGQAVALRHGVHGRPHLTARQRGRFRLLPWGTKECRSAIG